MKAWVTLNRGEINPKPGEYVQVLKTPETWCTWKCPKCEAYLSISKKNHTINYLGELNPMVSCPRQCGFTHWVLLEDWIPEAVGNA